MTACFLPVFVLFVPSLNALGIIQQYLNVPQTGGEFTFYGASGTGACGLDVVTCSAAVSGNLFDPAATWVPSTLPDGRYILNDPVCDGICVKIEYKGKTYAKVSVTSHFLEWFAGPIFERFGQNFLSFGL